MEIIMITICVDDWQRWKRKKDRKRVGKKEGNFIAFLW